MASVASASPTPLRKEVTKEISFILLEDNIKHIAYLDMSCDMIIL